MSRITKIIIIFLLVDIIGGVFLWYGYTSMQDKKAEESELRKEIALENDKGQKMIALRHSVDQAEPDHKALEQYLFDPSDESLIKFISRMEQLGMTTTGALVETRSLDRSGAKVHGDFTITGSFAQLYHFLRLVEELPTRVVINQLNIVRADPANTAAGKENVDSWNGSLSLDLVSLKS
jgi:Tfp pilus assembly protein PilO